MPTDQTAELAARVEALEREVRLLRARVIALERLTGSSAEHPADRETVREKATYDWQG